MTEENVIETEETEVKSEESNEVKEIREAFDAAIDSGEVDDSEIKLSMISAGATFNNVTRFYNKFMEASGMALSKEAKTTLADTAVSENDVTTEEGFDIAIEYVVANSDGKVKERSAGGLLRAAAKRVDVVCFKKTKASGAPRTSFRSRFYGMLIENPSMSEAEVEEYVKEQGTPSANKNIAIHQMVRKLANDIYANAA